MRPSPSSTRCSQSQPRARSARFPQRSNSTGQTACPRTACSASTISPSSAPRCAANGSHGSASSGCVPSVSRFSTPPPADAVPRRPGRCPGRPVSPRTCSHPIWGQRYPAQGLAGQEEGTRVELPGVTAPPGPATPAPGGAGPDQANLSPFHNSSTPPFARDGVEGANMRPAQRRRLQCSATILTRTAHRWSSTPASSPVRLTAPPAPALTARTPPARRSPASTPARRSRRRRRVSLRLTSCEPLIGSGRQRRVSSAGPTRTGFRRPAPAGSRPEPLRPPRRPPWCRPPERWPRRPSPGPGPHLWCGLVGVRVGHAMTGRAARGVAQGLLPRRPGQEGRSVADCWTQQEVTMIDDAVRPVADDDERTRDP
jgi:hypothetical protein